MCWSGLATEMCVKDNSNIKIIIYVAMAYAVPYLSDLKYWKQLNILNFVRLLYIASIPEAYLHEGFTSKLSTDYCYRE